MGVNNIGDELVKGGRFELGGLLLSMFFTCTGIPNLPPGFGTSGEMRGDWVFVGERLSSFGTTGMLGRSIGEIVDIVLTELLIVGSDCFCELCIILRTVVVDSGFETVSTPSLKLTGVLAWI